jgi:hypothetical protein
MSTTIAKIVNGFLESHHLLLYPSDVVVDIFELVIKPCLHSFKALADTLAIDPMHSPCHVLIFSIKVWLFISTIPILPRHDTQEQEYIVWKESGWCCSTLTHLDDSIVLMI